MSSAICPRSIPSSYLLAVYCHLLCVFIPLSALYCYTSPFYCQHFTVSYLLSFSVWPSSIANSTVSCLLSSAMCPHYIYISLFCICLLSPAIFPDSIAIFSLSAVTVICYMSALFVSSIASFSLTDFYCHILCVHIILSHVHFHLLYIRIILPALHCQLFTVICYLSALYCHLFFVIFPHSIVCSLLL